MRCADPAEKETLSYSAEVELEGSEPLAIFKLYYTV